MCPRKVGGGEEICEKVKGKNEEKVVGAGIDVGERNRDEERSSVERLRGKRGRRD